jgi:hypothetical protein
MSLELPVPGSLEVVLAENSARILERETFDYWIPRRLSWSSIPILEGVSKPEIFIRVLRRGYEEPRCVSEDEKGGVYSFRPRTKRVRSENGIEGGCG